MYIEKSENVEVYFICYKKEEMDLVESYYDEVLDIHYWYFNAYLAYQYWKMGFRGITLGEMEKNLLIVATSKYILYKLENSEYQDEKERKKLLRELAKIEPKLKKIIQKNEILKKL